MPGLYLLLMVMLLGVLTTWLGIDGPLLSAAFWSDKGFAGAIIGGAVGGLFTAFAGWLAWSGTQKQISQQGSMLALAQSEHRQRTIRVLLHVCGRLDLILVELLKANWEALQHLRDQMGSWEYAKIYPTVSEFPDLFEIEDYWRLEPEMQELFRNLNAMIRRYNDYPKATNIKQAENISVTLHMTLECHRMAYGQARERIKTLQGLG